MLFRSLEFREDGSLLQRQEQNPDGSKWTARYEYDNSGCLTIVRNEHADGHVDFQVHVYDPNGRLSRIVARSGNGDDRVSESFEYDADGRKTKTLYVDVANQRPDTTYAWGIEGSDSAYSAPGTTKLVTRHNDRGQPTTVLFCDSGGRTICRVELSYDADGNMIEEAQTNVPDLLFPGKLPELNEAQLEAVRTLFGASTKPIHRIHRYDQRGHRVETLFRFGPLGENRKTISYNNNGDPVAEVDEHLEREYGIEQDGSLSEAPTKERASRSEARLQYDYDARGNWIIKTVESRSGPDQDYIRCSVERRSISYFD